MTIREAIDQYIEWRRNHGSKFQVGAQLLYRFLRGIDEHSSCDKITRGQIRAFLKGNNGLTPGRANKYSALAGFYRYAISRGLVRESPLPDNEPKQPLSAPPYIYSHHELRRLFDGIDANRSNALKLDAHTFRTFLLLLYGAGLRSQEARCLTVEDVDLTTAVLAVRDTKFYKSRLVPVGPQLADALRAYAALRLTRPLPDGKHSCFLANRDGTPLIKDTVKLAFSQLRRSVGIGEMNGTYQRPCLHSFRHSFAVHRLTEWYRQGADVQELLPVLSTYLGHARLVHTQVYLSMTPELLQQASLRFERYLNGENNE